MHFKKSTLSVFSQLSFCTELSFDYLKVGTLYPNTKSNSQGLLPLHTPPAEYKLQKDSRNGWLSDSRRPRESMSPLRGLTFSESDTGPGYSYSFRSL